MWKIRHIDPGTGELTEAHHEGTLAQAVELFGEDRIVVAQRVALEMIVARSCPETGRMFERTRL